MVEKFTKNRNPDLTTSRSKAVEVERSKYRKGRTNA